MLKRPIVILLFTVLSAVPLSGAPEHFGGRFEIMNMAGINLYGLGAYTHTRWIDAEILFYCNLRVLSFGFLDRNRGYVAHWATFGLKIRPLEFRPFRDWRFKPYIGAGTFPFILRGYTMNLTVGAEWVQKKNFAFDINLKRFFTRESDVFEWLPGGDRDTRWALCLGVRL